MAPGKDVRKMAIALGKMQMQYYSLGHSVLIERHFALGNINVGISVS